MKTPPRGMGVVMPKDRPTLPYKVKLRSRERSFQKRLADLETALRLRDTAAILLWGPNVELARDGTPHPDYPPLVVRQMLIDQGFDPRYFWRP